MPYDDEVWELYHVAEDFSECHDLAASHPEKVDEPARIEIREVEKIVERVVEVPVYRWVLPEDVAFTGTSSTRLTGV